MIKNKICEYRIGVSEAKLTPFFVAGISPPDTSQYKGFTTTQKESDGGGVQIGYKVVELTWVNVSAKTVFELKKVVEAGLARLNREIFLTIPLNSGQTIASRQFNNVVGKVRPLQISEGRQGGRGMVYPSLTLALNNVVVLGVA